ncbi:peptidoglycan-N-acetylglucosamine deacetylase [Clostridium tepidiprofundi DSM 19306]|uniref:Peptidoglycan-N-acetylglucosamine deacetylase n=1 Tax=Clostridium tepidiprofundi DSM 19306 TaxID=1121338 RepID=A0A151B6N7_9CLOT|nr:polysaccharide deacetylase family sporulation protein PdaB [Clostridium tepidiprofundi]KYH35566.1 peptidoglycan-N-acetylglucosamine deacetylase [Clostridium tepidiprofundi DSM 19306]
MLDKYKKSTKIIGVVLALILIFAVAGIYVGVKNYNSTGVFFTTKKKLPIYCVDTDKKKVAITFDASWGSDKTESLLETLDKYNVRATFFLVGGWVDKYPDKVLEIYKRGHEIGNHSNTHPNMTRLSKEKIINEIAITDAKIMKITGEKTKVFRCPEGAYNDKVVEAVESTNHYCIQWDVDSIDWKAQGADLEYNRVIKKTKPGSIILFHNDAKFTPQNLPRVLEKLKSEGYEFVTVSELIYKDNYHMDHSGKQIKNNQ